jgi:hypothetical protein
MPRVFFPEPVMQFDLTAARERGEIVNLAQRANPLSTEETVRMFCDALEEHKFDPDTDWICLSGKAATLCLLCAAVSALYDKLPLLIFDARNSTYAERTINWDTHCST